MDLIDTHCHLTEFAPAELTLLRERALRCAVSRMVCIGSIDGARAAKQAVRLAEEHDFIWASVGIHPHDAAADWALDALEQLARNRRVVAVGETGLDFYRDWAPHEKQEELFRSTCALARKIRKPLIVHCREALAETLRILKEESAAEVGGVFHCYSGDAAFAEELRQINFLVSFTGNLTFKKAARLRQAAVEIPLEQIMLETDAPYMAPEPFRGERSEPMHVYQIALRLAEIKNLPLERIAEVTTKTAERFFSLR